MAIPVGRVLDLVAGWCVRAQDGAAGELRLWVKNGEIAIEERLRKPRPLILTKRAAGAPTGDFRDPVPALDLLPKTTRYRLKGCPRCGGDLHWEADRDAGTGRPPGAYGCLQCGHTV